MKRRQFLQIGVGSLMAASVAKAAEVCAPTPQQTEGPFYPVKNQADTDWDLTNVSGKKGTALGEVIWVGGVIRDQNCNPVEGALVEIWQACASGKYDHPQDPNKAPLDPNFQYWGKAVTDAKGQYVFKTIKPGSYPAAPGWVRPPHIHYKVTKLGYIEMITQLYFEGDALNSRDEILKRLKPSEQEQVVRPVEVRDHQGDLIKWVGFSLQIEKV
ncbi:hypothetical protein [Bdellovibrio sp. HCB337]|uniref:dioxygenase family protein n=1 Tax=Bdellovibrio sp. HCB337 TaxID=3394358 RepID=UPI0039A5D6AC